MVKIDIKLVSRIRAATGAALHICKRALEEAKGNVEQALEIVKKMGYAVARKKADRETSEGRIVGQIQKIGTGIYQGGLLECQSETDFVAMNEVFVDFTKQALEIGLKAGAKTLDELLALSFNDDQTVEQARQALIGQLGENVRISRYQFIETQETLGLYVHKDRYGCIAVLKDAHPNLAKEIAVHIVVSHPKDIAELLQQPFYKDPTKTIENYLKENASEVIQYTYFVLSGAEHQAE